jgi:hypothetical protein
MNPPSTLSHEVTTAFQSYSPLNPFTFPKWIEKRSIEMVKAAYLINDDAGQFPPTSAGDVPHVIAAHALLRYAHNLEMLHDNLNGLVVSEPALQFDTDRDNLTRALVTNIVRLSSLLSPFSRFSLPFPPPET